MQHHSLQVSNRTLFFFDSIKQKTILAALGEIARIAHLPKNKKREVELILFSVGGNCEAGFAFYDLTRSIIMNTSLSIVGTGEVASSAISVLLSADRKKRFITENTTLFLHEVSPSQGKDIITIGHKKFNKLPQELQASIIQSQETSIRIISKQTGLKPKKVLRMMQDETLLTAEEAVRYGFAHEIVPIR